MDSNESAPRETNLYLKILGYSASVITLVTILTYGYTTVYHYGYLRSFNIDIRVIDFSPKIVDIILQGTIACLLLVVSVAACLLSVSILKFLARKVGYFLSGLHRRLGWLRPEEDDTPKIFRDINTVVIILVIAFGLVFYLSDKSGYDTGQKQTQFTVVSDDRESLTVLIYQNGDAGVFKQYNKATKKFNNTYSVDTVSGTVFENIALER